MIFLVLLLLMKQWIRFYIGHLPMIVKDDHPAVTLSSIFMSTSCGARTAHIGQYAYTLLPGQCDIDEWITLIILSFFGGVC